MEVGDLSRREIKPDKAIVYELHTMAMANGQERRREEATGKAAILMISIPAGLPAAATFEASGVDARASRRTIAQG
jgi:hypothetical protein